MPAFAPPRQPQAREGSNFPFIQWFGRLRAEDEARREQSAKHEDFMICDEAMKAFAVGSEGNATFFVAGFAEDINPISSVPWNSAALIRGYQDRDWVALACEDARIKGAREMNPLALRLWFPVPTVKMNVFKDVKPTTFRLREMVAVPKKPPALKDVPPLVEVPLSLRGRW